MPDRRTKSAAQTTDQASLSSAPTSRRIQSHAPQTMSSGGGGPSGSNGTANAHGSSVSLSVKKELLEQETVAGPSSDHIPSSTPPRQSPNRRRRSDRDEAASDVSPRTEKRRRRSPSRTHQSDEEEDDNDGDAKVQIKAEKQTAKGANNFQVANPDRDKDGFLPGSIVRVALKNFVTYDSTEFRPGPYLNMIIGPNGTGKSTIVCAIALGLGWKPAVLGRAKDIASFVKQGYQDGWIEIELKGLAGEENVLIKRLISRKNNSSEWRLNGKASTARAVNDAVGRFDVNVDNLCCFLPQEKVADFARMDPPKLLVETQRAAGDPNLSSWHEQLIQLGEEYREILGQLNRDQDEQNNLEQRNEVLGRDVERYEQRKRLEEEIAVMNLLIPFAQYYNARTLYGDAKAIKNQRKAELEEARMIHEPLRLKVEAMKAKRSRLEANRGKVTESFNKVNKDLGAAARKMEQLENDTAELQDSMDNLKLHEKQHQKLVNQLRAIVAELEAKVAQEPPSADAGPFDRTLRELRQEIREIDEHRGDLKAQIDDLGLENRHLQNTHDETLRKLKRLDDARVRKSEMLRKADEPAFRAVQWLRANQNLFQKKVYEPIMLEITVKDSKYAAQVESCINWATMRTFVCETRADYDRLTRELIDKQKLRINVAELEGGRSTEQLEGSRPLTVQQVRQLGFNGYISDLIEGPESVMAYLYSSAHIHTIPVALTDSVDIDRVESSRQIKRYIVGHANHTIQWSEYGRKLPITLSRDIKPARSLTQSINTSEKEALEHTIREINQKFKDAEETVGKLTEEIRQEEEKGEDLRARKEEVEREKLDAMQPRRDWEKAKIDLGTKKARLNQELGRPSQDAERKRLRGEVIRLTDKRIKLVLDMKALLQTQTKHRIDLDLAILAEVQHNVNYQAWKELYNWKLSEFKDAEKLLKEALEDFAAAKKTATHLQSVAQTKHDEASYETQARFQARQEEMGNIESLDLQELETELATLRGSLELSAGVAPGVIEAFKKRAEQINKLGESIASQRHDVAKKETKIERIKSEWLPALEALRAKVSEKFSAAFDRIGCAGEVRISQQDDHHYEKWGIDILVKFRDTEQLQLLTGQRQSGGERSLSTILYLMSLTELSRSPFSLVDEINQGMDQRAERAVHDQMVEVTCRPSASQYFLITPKLLPDLRYHEKMKVLIINNGEWLPERLDLALFARKRRAFSLQRGLHGEHREAGGGGDGGGGVDGEEGRGNDVRSDLLRSVVVT